MWQELHTYKLLYLIQTVLLIFYDSTSKPVSKR